MAMKNIKIIMGTFEKGCGVIIRDVNTDMIYHKLVFENEKGCYIEVDNKFYYKEDVEINN